jgi:hypothetical protein
MEGEQGAMPARHGKQKTPNKGRIRTERKTFSHQNLKRDENTGLFMCSRTQNCCCHRNDYSGSISLTHLDNSTRKTTSIACHDCWWWLLACDKPVYACYGYGLMPQRWRRQWVWRPFSKRASKSFKNYGADKDWVPVDFLRWLTYSTSCLDACRETFYVVFGLTVP